MISNGSEKTLFVIRNPKRMSPFDEVGELCLRTVFQYQLIFLDSFAFFAGCQMKTGIKNTE